LFTVCQLAAFAPCKVINGVMTISAAIAKAISLNFWFIHFTSFFGFMESISSEVRIIEDERLLEHQNAKLL
jgi:hypothetical protein